MSNDLVLQLLKNAEKTKNNNNNNNINTVRTTEKIRLKNELNKLINEKNEIEARRGAMYIEWARIFGEYKGSAVMDDGTIYKSMNVTDSKTVRLEEIKATQESTNESLKEKKKRHEILDKIIQKNKNILEKRSKDSKDKRDKKAKYNEAEIDVLKNCNENECENILLLPDPMIAGNATDRLKKWEDLDINYPDNFDAIVLNQLSKIGYEIVEDQLRRLDVEYSMVLGQSKVESDMNPEALKDFKLAYESTKEKQKIVKKIIDIKKVIESDPKLFDEFLVTKWKAEDDANRELE